MALRVVLLDADAASRDFQVALLESEGFVVVAGGMDFTPEHVANLAPDLVVTDLVLPGRNGFTWLSDLRRVLGPGARILVYTGVKNAATAAVLAGADRALSKPAPRDRFREAVREVVGEGEFSRTLKR